MTITVRELLTKWGFQVDTEKVRAFNAQISTVKGTVTGIGKALAAVAGGVAAGGAALVKLTAHVAEGFDNVLKTSQKVAISTGALQMLKHAADLGDIAFQALSVGLRKFSDTTASAAAGNKTAVASFKALGVSVKDNKGKLKDNDELLFETLAALADMPDGAKKTAAALDLFGRAGDDLLPMLDGGSEALAKTMAEAKRLGLVFKKDALEGAADFNDSMVRLKAVFRGVAGTIAVQIMPLLTEWIKKAQAWLLVNKGMLASRIEEVVKRIADALREMVKAAEGANVFKTITDAVKLLGDVVAFLLKYKTEVKWFFIILAGMGIASKLSLVTGWIWKMVAAVWGLVAARKASAAAGGLTPGVKDIPGAGRWATPAALGGGAKAAASTALGAVGAGAAAGLAGMFVGESDARAKAELANRAMTDAAEALRSMMGRGAPAAAGLVAKAKEEVSMRFLGPAAGLVPALERLDARITAEPREGSFLAPAGAGSKNQTATVQVTNNMTVPPGTPAQMAKQIADEATKRMEASVRAAMAQLQGAS